MIRDIELNRDIPTTEVLRAQKYINIRENEFKKEKAIMEQKIEFLEAELLEFKKKDNENKKLNESIIMSYKNNDLARQENLINSIRDIKLKHQEELSNLKSHHNKEIRQLEVELKNCRQKIDQASHALERNKMEYEQKINEMRSEFIRKNSQQQQQGQKVFKKKQATFENKLKKAQNTIKIYKEYIEKMNHQNDRNEQFRELSVQYSFLLDDLKNEQGRRSVNPTSRQPLRERSMTILNQDELANSQFTMSRAEHNSRQSRKQDQRPKRATTITDTVREPAIRCSDATLTRRERSSKLLNAIQQKTKKSRKFLQYNRQNINQLTGRITRAVSSLDVCSKAYHDTKKIEFLKERIDRKLKIF